jgi:alpha-galactosidase
MSIKISMIGAGSICFSSAVAKEMAASSTLQGAEFMLMDVNEERLNISLKNIREIINTANAKIKVTATLNRVEALKDCDYIITACEKERIKYWKQDILIPRKHGVNQIQGENGGPGGIMHALRNITVFMDIASDIRKYCPDVWVMNFTNPMSFVCTYMQKHSGIKTVGLCHQIHGSLGIVTEMLGMEPGDLQTLAVGINHLAFLLDIRKRGCQKSFMKEFKELVYKSKYWKENVEAVPEQIFTLEFFKTFGFYPVGYDNHIAEYLPFFYDKSEWESLNYPDRIASLDKMEEQCPSADLGLKERMELSAVKYPFPRNPDNPYYQEKACAIIEALETNEPTYLDSTVIVNRGAIENLPVDAVVDIPSVVVGGEVRPLHIGKLPIAAAEICRRQITIHELTVEAGITGNREKLLQAFALDPYIHSLKQANNVLEDFLNFYKEDLPQFQI